MVVALLLLVAAAAVLVVSVWIGEPDWAWVSVLLSAVAALALIVAQARRRRLAREAATTSRRGAAGVPAESVADPSVSAPARTARTEDAEPPEEDTDAADLLVVSELDVPVVVLDERPRYHLDSCGWLGERRTISVPVSEARELGFTPCARCTPDAVLAAGRRDDP